MRGDLRQVRVGDETLLIDRYGIRPPARLTDVELAVAMQIGRPVDAIREHVARTHAVSLSRADVAAFARELEAAAILDGKTAARDRRDAWARAIVDGALVLSRSRTSDEELALCTSLLDEARARPRRAGRLEGLLAPHGDLAATGACSAAAYAMLDRESWPDVFVVIGTSHYALTPTLLSKDVHTPLGRVRTDRDLVGALQARHPWLRLDEPDLLVEHSWSQDLTLLQTVARALSRPLRIVALLIGDASETRARALGRDVRDLLFHQLKRGCLVASGDLTHYGEGYGYEPAWLAPSTVRQVATDIATHEAPILAAIERRDRDAFAVAVQPTSFCARQHVSSLLSYAGDDGVLLARRTIVNWEPLADDAPDRRWQVTDTIFNGASIAFTWGGDGPRRLCSSCIWRETKDEIELLHRCDVGFFGVPRALLPLVRELARGFSTVPELHARLGPLRDFDEAELAAFVAHLDAQHLFHAYELPSHRPSRFVKGRAEHTIDHARASVPFYAKLGSRRLARAPLLTKALIQRDWTSLFARDISESLGTRTSSSSSGDPLVSVVEERARKTRRFGELLVRSDGAALRAVHLARPTNLSLDGGRGWPATREEGRVLAITPGPNPSAITDDTWSRTLAACRRFAPDSIEGDPAYVAELARRAVGVLDPKRVTVGGSYPWRTYLDAIRRAFPSAELVRRYHSSELGEMGVSCEAGSYHLNETRMCFEILRRGRDARVGQIGALVATTLDSRARPLVRYAIGDAVRLVAASCPCGAPFRTIDFIGRTADLFLDGKRRLVGHPELDALIGAPAGLRFFRVHAGASIHLEVCGDRHVLDVGALRDRVAESLHLRTRVTRVDELDCPRDGKLLSVDVRRSRSAILDT